MSTYPYYIEVKRKSYVEYKGWFDLPEQTSGWAWRVMNPCPNRGASMVRGEGFERSRRKAKRAAERFIRDGLGEWVKV